jgi:hypothetical protein
MARNRNFQKTCQAPESVEMPLKPLIRNGIKIRGKATIHPLSLDTIGIGDKNTI